MRPSIELLFQCRCDKCNVWWGVSDLPPGHVAYCHNCGHANRVEGYDYPPALGVTANQLRGALGAIERAAVNLTLKESAALGVGDGGAGLVITPPLEPSHF